MRESGWRITWNPAGESSRVLLDFGDLMDGEIQRDLVQVVDVGRFDQATQGRPFGRKNRKRRLEFNRLVEFTNGAEAFLSMLDAASNDPWGEKQLIQIAPILGGSAYGRAALLSFEREFVTQPYPGYVEKYAFRIDSGTTGPGTPAITILEGWFNPPVEGGGTSSGSITVTLPPDHGIVAGDVVYVSGVSGVTSGYYPVTNVSGNNVTIGAASNGQPVEEFPDVFGTDALDPHNPNESPHFGAGAVNFNGTVSLHVSGMTEVGASYQWRSGGDWNDISPDGFGRAEITFSTRLLRIDHGAWYRASYSGAVLIIDGETQPPQANPPGFQVTESRTFLDLFELRKNGVKIDEHRISPNFKTRKLHTYMGPRFHEVATGKTVTATLRADGGMARLGTGVAEIITSGTVQKAE